MNHICELKVDYVACASLLIGVHVTKEREYEDEADASEIKAAESVSERLHNAVGSLCIGEGDIRARLKDALITLLPLLADEFPSELQEKFRWAMEQSTKYESEASTHGESINAMMENISGSKAAEIAKQIFSIYEEIHSIRGYSLVG